MAAMTLDEFAGLLRRVRAAVPAAEHEGLKHGAELIREEAKDLIGTEYAAWAPLADSTVARKEALGQTGRVSATDPLLATGELRASIGVSIEGETAIVGTEDPVGLYMETGTLHVPSRPFLAPAAFRKGEAAANAIGAAVGHLLAGKRPPWA